jgi:hypothetical protein
MHCEDIKAREVLETSRTQPLFDIPRDVSFDSSVPSAEQIRRALRHRLAKAGNKGFWKRLSVVVLEPANPFNTRASRKFRDEAIVLMALLLFAVSIVAIFNLSAIAR